MRNLFFAVGLLLIISISGCNFGGNKQQVPETKKTGTASATNAAQASNSKYKSGDLMVQDGAGKTIFKATPMADAFTAEDNSGNFVFFVERVMPAGNFIFRDAKEGASPPSGMVKANGTGRNLEDGSGNKLATIEARDGGYRIKDASGKYLAKLKPNGSECKIGDEAGNKIGKTKVKGDKILVEDANGAILYQIYGVKDVLAAGV